MGIRLKVNEMNEISKGTVIYDAEAPVDYICVLLKGRVELYNEGSRVLFGSGSFLGVQDLGMGRYLSGCMAVEDSIIYAFPAAGPQIVERILSMNKDYHGLMMYTVVRYVSMLYHIREEMKAKAEEGYRLLMSLYHEYMNCAREIGMLSPKIAEIESFAVIDTDSVIDQKKLVYYLEMASVPLDVIKAFYGSSIGLTQYPLEQAGGVCTELILENTEYAGYLVSLRKLLFASENEGLIAGMAKLLFRAKTDKNGETVSKRLSGQVDACMDLLNGIEELLEKKTGQTAFADREKIEKLYVSILTGKPEKSSGIEEIRTEDDELVLLEDSLGQITGFAGFDAEKTEQFRILLHGFEELQDKTATDDTSRQLRRGISALFYDLYEMVFLRAGGRRDLPKPVDLFLNFGFLSEKLLTDSEKKYLMSLIGVKFTGPCGNGRVYTIREWLNAIFEGRREPSKSEMDEDYTEYVRNLRKSNKITEKDEQQMMLDRHKKLNYEIRNMFQSNNRMVNGQISTFVPVLHHEMFFQEPQSMLLDLPKLDAVVERLKSIDYSVFYRDVLYSRPDKGIDKIYIQKEYYPDIILMPTAGSRSSMWQECAGKRRESAGRFIFPVFFEGDLESAMAKMFGRYRWELCRFLQGGSWNNIKYHSLTSEYCDYIQFYRKNHDLSEERKEKLKLQIQKAKNSTREVFVMDYELWVRSESTGAIRLNKTAREILALYCPFAKKVRKALTGQPIFEEALARAERERAKAIYEMDIRIRQIARDTKEEVPKEIMDTLKYYQNN